MMIITGEQGVGKTVLAQSIADIFGLQTQRQTLWVDACDVVRPWSYQNYKLVVIEGSNEENIIKFKTENPLIAWNVPIIFVCQTIPGKPPVTYSKDLPINEFSIINL